MMRGPIRFAKVTVLVAMCAFAALAFAALADAPPLTPMESFYGNPAASSGGGGGGGGTITGTGTLPQVAFWTGATSIGGDPGLTYVAAADALTWPGVTGSANIAPGSCVSSLTSVSCLKLDGGTDASIGLADGNVMYTQNGYYYAFVDDAAAGAWPVFYADREVADGTSSFTAILYLGNKGSLITANPVAADDRPVVALVADANATGGDGVVHVGTQANRSAASANALFCASKNINTADPDVLISESCAFADGTWQSGAGATAKPTYSWLLDSDTGFYNSTTDTIGVSAGNNLVSLFNTSGMRVPANFSVAIGPATINTTFELELARASGNSRYRQTTNDTAQTARAIFELQANNNGAGLGVDNVFLSKNSNLYVGNGPGMLPGASAFQAQGELEISTWIGIDNGIPASVADVPEIVFLTTTSANPASVLERMRIKDSEVVVNEQSLDIDFRVETDTKSDSFFINAGAETTRLNGGASNGGCDISAAGNLACQGTIAGSGTITGSGANTQVTFWTGASTVSGDAGMTYNSATDSLTLAGDLAVNGSDINFPAGAAARITVAAPGGSLTIGSGNGAMTINGDGAATTINHNGANTVFNATDTVTTIASAGGSNDSNFIISDTGSNGAISVNLDAISRWGMDTNGHVYSDAIGIGAVTSGTCTNEAATADSNSMRGEVEADCTAGQTIVVDYSDWSTTPFCVVSASNAAGGASVVAGTASTTVLTITIIGAVTDGRFAWMCLQ